MDDDAWLSEQIEQAAAARKAARGPRNGIFHASATARYVALQEVRVRRGRPDRPAAPEGDTDG